MQSWHSLNALPGYRRWILDGLRSEQIEEICGRLTTDADASDNENHSRPCAASDKMTTYPAQQCGGRSVINKCDRWKTKTQVLSFLTGLALKTQFLRENELRAERRKRKRRSEEEAAAEGEP